LRLWADDFGAYLTHDSSCFVFFGIEGLSFLVFKA